MPDGMSVRRTVCAGVSVSVAFFFPWHLCFPVALDGWIVRLVWVEKVTSVDCRVTGDFMLGHCVDILFLRSGNGDGADE